jgi:hypothetical protein
MVTAAANMINPLPQDNCDMIVAPNSREGYRVYGGEAQGTIDVLATQRRG